jgi:peptidoglycan/xylan/chitin deacetylase (PgdA/CDA1 family)
MNDVLLLCYHAISAEWPAEDAVRSGELEQQLRLLVRRGYRGVTFHQAVTSPPPGKVLAVTFDDAYRSVLEIAYPILSVLGIPATVFVVTDFANDDRLLAWPGIDHWIGSTHREELRALSWSQLEGLCERGWEVGSHSQTHPRLTQLDDTRLRSELRGSRAVCERALGRPCRSLAYPYGDVDARVAMAARDAGYEVAAALPARLDGATRMTLPRIGIYRSDSLRRFRLKVSPGMRRLRRMAGPAEALMRRNA